MGEKRKKEKKKVIQIDMLGFIFKPANKLI